MLNKFEGTSLSNSTIISFKDFVRYDLKPFNIVSKNSTNIVVREPNFSFMHQWIYPIEEEVSNRTFNQLFHIKYFLEFRSNINKYNLKDYEIDKVLNVRNDQLFYSKINILMLDYILMIKTLILKPISAQLYIQLIVF